MRILVSDRQKRGGDIAAWTVNAESGGVATSTEYVFLRWDDIVRRYWPRGTPGIWRVMWRNLREYSSSGVLCSGRAGTRRPRPTSGSLPR